MFRLVTIIRESSTSLLSPRYSFISAVKVKNASLIHSGLEKLKAPVNFITIRIVKKVETMQNLINRCSLVSFWSDEILLGSIYIS